MKFISPLIKITDTCNFNCHFCYYAQKQSNIDMSKKIMPFKLLEKVIYELCELNLKNDNNICHLIFHGGEPMLAGLKYFEDIIDFQEKLKKVFPNIIFKNSIQTNGFMINEKWADFFKQNDFGVSISIDGDTNLNFHKLENVKVNSDDIVLNNLKLLIERGVVVTVMSVITNNHIGHEKRLYDFYKKYNIKNVAFCFCYNKDTNDSVDAIKLGEFLINFFDLYYYGDYELHVRDFESIICKLVGKSNGLCLYSDRNDCGDFPSIDSSGNVYFCDVATEKDRTLGNVNDSTLEEIFLSEKFLQEKESSQRILNESCENCDMKDYCGKICYRTDEINEQNKCFNYFCESYKMIISHVKKTLEKEFDLK